MERKSSPEPGTGTSLHDAPMAAASAAVPPPPPPPASKRYRPAPAKTFQCRGYGDCRMVFSRSEHLARHIRKHTGERPFTCHCSKQFSRLDNLRQHAQTVHADKHEQNERMMRDLTSLHASMAAANKISNARTARRVHTPPARTADDRPPIVPVKHDDLAPIVPVKHDDLAPIAPLKHDDLAPYPGPELYPPWPHDFQPFAAAASRPPTSERLPPLSSIVPQPQPPPHLRPRPAAAARPLSSSSYPKPPYRPYYDAADAPAADPSPFYFAPPHSAASPPPPNPRKRAFSGPDGPVHAYDDLAQQPAPLDYDYGSESRPQSRRLSVMELCNTAGSGLIDGFIDPGDRPLGLVSTMSVFERPHRRTSPASSTSDDGPARISPPARRLTPHAHAHAHAHAIPPANTEPIPAPPAYPPPRPHSTAFSVSSASSPSAGNSPPVAAGYAAGHFAAYPHSQHPPYTPLHLVGAMSSLHHHPHPHPHPHYASSSAPPSAPSYYPPSAPSPRESPSASFSPRSPPGHVPHQQAQPFHALHQDALHQATPYPHPHAYAPGAYEYAHGYSA